MAIKGIGKGLKGALQGAVDTVKSTVQDVKIPEIKTPEIKVPQVKDLFQKREKPTDTEPLSITSISTRSALQVIFYLMAADGQILQSEEERFDSIGSELDPEYAAHKKDIITECGKQLDKVIDPEDYYDVLRDGVDLALQASRQTADTFITPKLLVWDLLAVAHSDGKYDDTERKLIKYIVRKLNVDKAVFLEMESSLLTLMDLEGELQWIKTTDRPYLTIETIVNEIADRKNVIFESVKDLITL